MSNSPDYLYFQQLWLTKSIITSGFYLTLRMEKSVPFYTVNACSEFVGSQIKISRQGLFNFLAKATWLKKSPFPTLILIFDLFYFTLSKILIDCGF